jgi:hypothetical protein
LLVPAKVLSVPAEMPRRCAAVSGWVEELPELLLNAADHGATIIWRARSAEMQAPWSTRQYLALQVRMTAKWADFVKTEPVQLGLVESMSVLVLVAV